MQDKPEQFNTKLKDRKIKDRPRIQNLGLIGVNTKRIKNHLELALEHGDNFNIYIYFIHQNSLSLIEV